MQTQTATVHDSTRAQFQRSVNLRQTPATVTEFSVFDDLADGIEALHHLANLAGFSERPRSFILTLISAAKNTKEKAVKLYDEDLAELMGCSARTVRRQRADYQREAKARNFGFVEIIEGPFDKEKKCYLPTEYVLHLEDEINQTVMGARGSRMWVNGNRGKQQEAIKFYASKVYDEIPEAPRGRKRKPRRDRLATAEISTCQKVIETTFKKLQDRTDKLPYAEQEKLLDDPGEMREWYLKMRAEMDVFFNVKNGDFPQPLDNKGFDPHTGQTCPVSPPPAEPVSADTPEGNQVRPPEARACPNKEEEKVRTATREFTQEDQDDWRSVEARLDQPQVVRVDIPLRADALPPDDEDGGGIDTLTVDLDAREVQTGPAFWRSDDGDMPVTVTGDLGIGRDRRRYISIKEGRCGIPFDEVEYLDPDEIAERMAIQAEANNFPVDKEFYVAPEEIIQ
jgi:hypothetical protein